MVQIGVGNGNPVANDEAAFAKMHAKGGRKDQHQGKHHQPVGGGHVVGIGGCAGLTGDGTTGGQGCDQNGDGQEIERNGSEVAWHCRILMKYPQYYCFFGRLYSNSWSFCVPRRW